MTSEAQPLGRTSDDAGEGSTANSYLDFATALLLATAALASAWSAYQATRWSGEQANAYDRASALRAESIRASNRAFQQIQIDVTSFVAWSLIRSEENLVAADFLRERFRREFVPAFEHWRSGAAAGGIPPGTPFELPEYELAAQREAQRLSEEAEATSASARRANQLSDNFVFSVVLFTTVVFFGGIQTKTETLWLRRSMLAVSTTILVVALFLTLRMPQNVGF